MKTIDWQRFFEKQRREDGKVVYTVAELANVGGHSARVLNVELDRLVKRGVLTRYAWGKYGPTEGVAPQDLLPFLDAGAYITGLFALHRHNLITQTPVEISCFTNRRHNRSRKRLTPLGPFLFVCVGSQIYDPPSEGCFAPPEQALCDFVFLTNREGLDIETLVTFRNLVRLDQAKLKRILPRYPKSVGLKVQRLQLVRQPLIPNPQVPAKPPNLLEKDGPELEAELLKAVNGSHSPYSSEEMRDACKQIVRDKHG